jgi:hypothetical protein
VPTAANATLGDSIPNLMLPRVNQAYNPPRADLLKEPCRGPCEIRLEYGGGRGQPDFPPSRAPYLCCANNQPGSEGSV